VASAGQAHAVQGTQKEVQPLAGRLNPDGGLDPSIGFRGTLDAVGWHTTYAEDDAPLFGLASEALSPQSPANNWNSVGAALDGDVYAVAVAGPNVYVGGTFTRTGGGGTLNCIARWDRTA
jgi:hypothetical protein